MADLHQAAPLHGVMAEFADATELVAAAKAAHAAGYRQMDAYTAAPIHGLAEALGHDDRRVQKMTFTGGVLGFLGGFALCYWTSVIDYPLNIGGRPLNSWPQFIPVTFETTVLGAALTCFIGMWALNKLPMPYHPVFNVPAFDRASRDRFFLCIEATDPRFDARTTRTFLESLHPVGVSDVAP
jgi:hypothetical protein